VQCAKSAGAVWQNGDMTIAAGHSRAAALGAAARETDYLPALTGLRGIAAGWVLLFHLWQFSGAPTLAVRIAGLVLDFTPLAACGFLGVDLFFVLSGFLLSIPFHRAALQREPMPSLRTFWQRRCRRVLPAYYVQLAILLGVLVMRGDTDLTPTNLISHVLLAQNLVAVREVFNGVYWTMPIEWDFYLVLPLLALLLARVRASFALASVLALAIAFRIVCYQVAVDPTWARHLDYGNIIQLPARVDEFFFGMLGAWLHVRTPSRVRARHWMLVGAAAIVIVMVLFTHLGDYVATPRLPWLLLHFTWVGAALGVFVWGAASQQRWFCGRALAWLGLISYSLYLWHYPLLQLAQHFDLLAIGSAGAMLRDALLAVPPILLVAWVSQHFVERPFLAGHQRKVADLQQAAATP
jgi:peptidoglycan/LPS O-acetylase OafA/YrhL